MVGGIGDLAIMDDLMPLGVCPLQLAGTDTDLLFAAASERAEKFARWYRPQPVQGVRP